MNAATINLPAPIISNEDGYLTAKIQRILGVRETNVEALVSALADAVGISAGAQRDGICLALCSVVRHAGRDLERGGAVDFDEVTLCRLGKRVMLAYSGAASAAHRGHPNRFMLSYDHHLTVGIRGGLSAWDRSGKQITGDSVASGWSYFGKPA